MIEVGLFCSPSVVLWTVNNEPAADVHEVLAKVGKPAHGLNVVVTSNNPQTVVVAGLDPTPFALNALVPMALWHSHGHKRAEGET